jgi:transcriptional regulator with XRE-family HTH domain
VIRLTDADQIADALVEMRKSREETRRSLAERAGMSEQQYGPYEIGRRLPRLEPLLRLTDAANYDVILMPRELVDGLLDLARAIPFNALAALAAVARLDEP